MKKTLVVVALVSVLSLIFLGSSGLAQQKHWDCCEASWLIGYRAYSPDGIYDLGQISNLVVDQSNGRIALVSLSDVPGFGAEQVAIPFGSLIRNFRISFPPNIQTSFSGGQPYYNPYDKAMAVGVVPSVIDSTWVAQIFNQYERIPYWTEKGEQPYNEILRKRQIDWC